MNHNCYQKVHPESVSCIGVYEALTTEKVMMDGRIVSRSKYVLDDPIERMKGINPLDFCLENQLAAGVDLEEVKMSNSAFVACSSLPIVELKSE